nr:hypothetical protein GCM10020092_039530 [Actinoplanes digitatis]
MVLIGLHTQAANRRQFRLLARLSHHFLDVVAGLPTLKLFGRARAQADAIRRISADQRRLTMRTLRTAFLSSLVLELLATLSVALVAVGVGLRLVSGELDLTTALLVLILAPEAYLPLRQVGANYHASAEGLAAAAEAFELLETPVPAAGTAAAPDGALVFEDVVVRYPGRDGDALRLSARIEPGEVVALTGPSGCGKSTALAALLGLVAPASGRITVGGVPLATVEPGAWRARIAWVPQRPHLFAGTVDENIALGGAGDVARRGPACRGVRLHRRRRCARRRRHGPVRRAAAAGRAGPGFPARRADRAARRADRQSRRRHRRGRHGRGAAARARPYRRHRGAPPGADRPGRPRDQPGAGGGGAEVNVLAVLRPGSG